MKMGEFLLLELGFQEFRGIFCPWSWDSVSVGGTVGAGSGGRWQPRCVPAGLWHWHPGAAVPEAFPALLQVFPGRSWAGSAGSCGSWLRTGTVAICAWDTRNPPLNLNTSPLHPSAALAQCSAQDLLGTSPRNVFPEHGCKKFLLLPQNPPQVRFLPYVSLQYTKRVE